MRARGETGFKLAQERDVQSAEERDRLGLADARRERSRQERTVLLAERHRGNVRLIDDRVDDREMTLGMVARDLREVFVHQETDREDLVEVFVGERAQIGLIVGG